MIIPGNMTCANLGSCCTQASTDNAMGIIRFCLPCIVCWEIWKERKRQVSEGTCFNFQLLVIFLLLGKFAVFLKPNFFYSFSNQFSSVRLYNLQLLKVLCAVKCISGWLCNCKHVIVCGSAGCDLRLKRFSG